MIHGTLESTTGHKQFPRDIGALCGVTLSAAGRVGLESDRRTRLYWEQPRTFTITGANKQAGS